MTNLEKIQTMGIYEMIKFLDRNAGCGVCSVKDDCNCDGEDPCKKHIKEWLESEADEQDA